MLGLRYRSAFLFVLLSLFSAKMEAQVKLQLPLNGVAGVDYWIVNYVDHDLTPGLNNYACGNKTYDGHEGTDFLIRSFKTMDSGVYVHAAADGIVFKLQDGVFDRSKKVNNGGLGNYVAINHSNTLYAYYGHLMKDSLLVKVGDTVKVGQRIGKVASSGRSTDPHLHLEVYDINSNLVDPFAGTCQTNTASAWVAQPIYDTSLLVIDEGFTSYSNNLDTLRERYDVRDTFYTLLDTAVNYWVQLQGVRKNDVQRVDWYTPTGSYWFSFSYTTPQDYWYYYFWTYINMPNDSLAGKWNAKYYVNNQFVTQRDFYVMKGTGIHTLLKDNKVHLYPNPCQDYFQLSSTVPESEVYLYNTLGEMVRKYVREHQMSLSGLPKGMYFVQYEGNYYPLVKQ